MIKCAYISLIGALLLFVGVAKGADYNMAPGTINVPCGTVHNFYDPQGPTADYLANTSITSVFTSATAGQCLSITFTTFNTQATNDVLIVYNGLGTGGAVLGTYSGNLTTVPFTITSTLGSVTMVFTTNANNQGAGWTATMTCTACPPTNDNPCSATPLTAGTSCNYVQSTNAGATASGGVPAPGCALYAGGDVWFTVVVPASGSILLDTQTGVVTDGGMAVYSGTCSALTLISCDDDGSPNGLMPSLTVTGQTPGSTLWIRFWEYNNDGNGTFGICATATACISCSNATPITAVPFNGSYTSCGACNDVISGNACTSLYLGGEDYLFTYTPSATGPFNIVLTGTSTYTGVFVTQGCPTSGGTCVGSATQSGGNPALNNITLTAGVTYYIVVDTWPAPNCTPFTINVSQAVVTPPNGNGDVCTNSTPFCTGSTYSFPNNTGIPGLGAINCLFSTPNPVWYYMQIDEPGNLNITISQTNAAGAGLDVDFNLWGPFTSLTDGCSQIAGGTAPSIDCSFSPAPVEEANITGAIAGQYYILLMTNFSGQAGTISFSSLSTSTATTNCDILCNITALTAAPSACSAFTNTYSVNGTITVQNPPSSGILTVSSSCGGSVTIPQPWGTSIPYSLTGLTSNGASCAITASFSADPLCTFTTNYTAPASCTATTLNCPGYSNTATGTGLACADQAYYIEIPNTSCNGTVTFQVVGNYGSSFANELTWNVVSNLTGTVVASGGPGVNAAPINTTVGPISANTFGNIFTLNIIDSFGDGFNGIGGFIGITQSGNNLTTPISGPFGLNANSIFGANVAISPATITINTPSGPVVATEFNCSDFRVPVTLVNSNYCNTVAVNLPWSISCNATGAIISSGTTNVTVYPQVPNSYDDIVTITFNSSTCQWTMSGASDCDMSDIGTIFTVSPNPTTLPAASCSAGNRTFTIDYLGPSPGPDCCNTAGPLAPVSWNQTFNTGNVSVVSSPFGGVNNAALLNIAPFGIGGNATSFTLNVNLNGFCFNPPSTGTNSSYWVTVVVGGQIISDVITATPGPSNYTQTFNLAQLPAGFDSGTSMQVYVYPNAFNAGGVNTTYVPGANCASLADGVWTGVLSASLNVVFEEFVGTPAVCTFTPSIPYNCCSFTSVPNTNTSICHGNSVSSTISTWQNAVNAANTSCVVFSSVTPIAGVIAPNSIFPNGLNPGTSSITQTVSAYSYCDSNGSGTVNAGDTYTLISTLSITVLPQIITTLIFHN